MKPRMTTPPLTSSTDRPLNFPLAGVGAALVVAGRRRGGASGLAAGLLGLGAVVHSLYPSVRRQLLRLGRERRVVHLQHTVFIDRPVRDVFEFCKDFENFPRIVGSLRRVVDYQDGRSHWEVATPAGRIVTWEAVVTKYVPSSVIAWSSVPGSKVASSGLVRFTPGDHGGTVVEVHLDYEPGATSLSDALRALIDVPREQQLRADLDRASFYLEALPAQLETNESTIGEARPIPA
jgi:uncharacterized membrane protein